MGSGNLWGSGTVGEIAVLRKTTPYALIVSIMVGVLTFVGTIFVPPFEPTIAVRVIVICTLTTLVSSIMLWYVNTVEGMSKRAYNVTLTAAIAMVTIPVAATVSEHTWWRLVCIAIAIMAAGGIHIEMRWMTVNVIIGWGSFLFMTFMYHTDMNANMDEFDPLAEFIMIIGISTITAYTILRVRGYTFRIMFEEHDRVRNENVRDLLTGVYNRRVMDNQLLIEQFSRRPVRVLYCDIRGLKQVNDRYGHKWGDRVIQAVATGLKESVRDEDVVVRAGGDEFVVLTTYTEIDISFIKTRVLSYIGSNSEIPHEIWNPDITIGISKEGCLSDVHLDTLVTEADHDMYSQRIDQQLGTVPLSS